MIWIFLAVALYLAVVSPGFRKFLLWTGGVALVLLGAMCLIALAAHT